MEAFKQKLFKFSTLSLELNFFEEKESNEVKKLSAPLFPHPEEKSKQSYVFQKCLLHYTEQEFKDCFGLNRSTFNYLVDFLNQNKFFTPQINTEKAMLITIWYLRNLEKLEQISLRFNLSNYLLKQTLEGTTSFFTKSMEKFIKWPCIQDAHIIKSNFANQVNITGIIGAIGAYHLKINGQKHKTHLIIQGICDNKHKFTDVTCGEVGVSHVAQILKKSTIYHKGEDGFFGSDFLLGTNSYPCLSWLVPPYKNNFSERHKIFNEKHFLATAVIKNTFRMVIKRFCRLQHFYNENNLFIKNCLITACILNNVCIDLNDQLDEDDGFINEEEEICDPDVFKPEIFSKRNEVFHEMFVKDS